ncbi:MAG: VTT domain-containing protein [Clostridia bacterium]
MKYKELPAQEKRRRWLALAGIAGFIMIMGALFVLFGKALSKFAADPELFRIWVNEHGIWSRIAFIGMVIIQIIVAVIPGEPFEIVAGYAFGIWEGTALCVLGTFIGGVIVFLFVRKIGIKAVEVFFPREKINSLKFLRDEKKVDLIAFIIFLIPGMPKDILTYCVGLTKMKLGTWMLITSLARIPSIITSTIGGNALGLENYMFAIIVFAVTIVISGIGLLIYRRINATKQV